MNNSPVPFVTSRVEIVGAASNTINLGPDQTFCDQNSFTINSGVDASIPVIWSDGETTSSITVTQSGLFSVEDQNCPSVADTVGIFFLGSPPPITLGDDFAFCGSGTHVFSPLQDTTNFEFLWQDGSTKPEFVATSPGTYSVTIKNQCGSSSDSVLVSRIVFDGMQVPDVITPGNDHYNDVFLIPDDFAGKVNLFVVNRWGKEVFRSENYNNDWNGGDLATGTYYVRLTGDCVEFKGWLAILR